jgi:hypothetical protein
MTLKEDYNFLGGEEQPRKQQLPWQSSVSLEVVDPQEN